MKTGYKWIKSHVQIFKYHNDIILSKTKAWWMIKMNPFQQFNHLIWMFFSISAFQRGIWRQPDWSGLQVPVERPQPNDIRWTWHDQQDARSAWLQRQRWSAGRTRRWEPYTVCVWITEKCQWIWINDYCHALDRSRRGRSRLIYNYRPLCFLDLGWLIIIGGFVFLGW